MRYLNWVYKLLERPHIYSFVQMALGVGGAKLKSKMISDIISEVRQGQILDVGCGPATPLLEFNVLPIGCDINRQYVIDYIGKTGVPGFVCSVDSLPLRDAAFDGVWSRGLFHHVPDAVARRGICEMIRVSKDGGYVVVLDAVMPEFAWKKPLAYLIRKADRGKYMRTQDELESLLSDKNEWQIRRVKYNHLTGVEMLVCIYHKEI